MAYSRVRGHGCDARKPAAFSQMCVILKLKVGVPVSKDSKTSHRPQTTRGLRVGEPRL